MVKNGPGDPVWGWKMLMHDLRNPEQPEQPSQQQSQQPTTQGTIPVISNIVNYPPMPNVPMRSNKLHFASIYAIIVIVTLLIIAGVLLWKTGAIDYLIETCRSLL
jgi:hypothetical protein